MLSSRENMTPQQWLRWVKQLQAIAQDGLTYATNRYDLERYEKLRETVAEILAAYSTGSLEHSRELLEAEKGPATPKVGVRAAVFREGRILLIKEPADGLWAPPGGWADVGESPSEAVAREVYEESGYRARAVKLLSVYDQDRQNMTPIPYQVYILSFLCELVDEAPSSGADADGVDFFKEDELPDLSPHRVTPAQISFLFERHRRPDLPAYFD